jgi:hypothetical protein
VCLATEVAAERELLRWFIYFAGNCLYLTYASHAEPRGLDRRQVIDLYPND